MEAYGAIDPQTSQEARLTNEEAQAVIGLWSLQKRLSEDALSRPSVSDIAESLNISPDEVRKYLELARAQSKQERTPRSLKTDLTLAFAALAVLAFIVFCATAFFVTRRQVYPVPAYTTSNFTPVPSIPGFSGQVPRSALIGYSKNPNRLVIGVGSTMVTPRQSSNSPLNESFIRQSLRAAIGGPMADSSSFSNRSVAQFEIVAALRKGPTENSELLQWKKIQVAYGGKVVEGHFPFSKLADKDMRIAIETKHARLIEELVESVMSQIGK